MADLYCGCSEAVENSRHIPSLSRFRTTKEKVSDVLTTFKFSYHTFYLKNETGGEGM